MGMIVFAILLTLAFQNQDQTVRAYGGADHVWQVATLRGSPFPARATLAFPKIGMIAGEAPCNSYRAAMHIPYPWFGTERIITTKRACPDLAVETAFLSALQEATLAEVGPQELILKNEAGDLLLRFIPVD